MEDKIKEPVDVSSVLVKKFNGPAESEDVAEVIWVDYKARIKMTFFQDGSKLSSKRESF